MQDTLISFETAKLAKTLEFDWLVQNRYRKDGGLNLDLQMRYDTPVNYNDDCFQDEYRIYTSAPSQDLLRKWIEKKYGVIVFVENEFIDDSESAWTWTIKIPVPEGVKGSRKKDEWDFWKQYGSFYNEQNWWKTYEEAMEQGLKKALKKISNTK